MNTITSRTCGTGARSLAIKLHAQGQRLDRRGLSLARQSITPSDQSLHWNSQNDLYAG